uniref:Uncharacterized protein n=1 Tax=Panagrolaimus sp. PS1159 TaxID=55785 RepID=A0AC35GG69_9BILA
MYLFLIIFILHFSNCNGCFGASGGGAPDIPLCATCGDVPVLMSPGGGGTMDQPGGTVVSATGADGCKTYTVTCPTAGQTPAVIIGANGVATALTGFTPGEKTATLTCSDAGVVEGTTDPDGMTVTVMSVYCSRN